MQRLDINTIILAFDVGTHNTGVAIYKSGFVQALHTLKHNKTPNKILTAILNDISRYNPHIVVLGIPRRGNITNLVLWLQQRLIERCPNLQVDTIKEDNTTRYAKDLIIIDGMSEITATLFTRKAKRRKLEKAKRRGLIDRNAAIMILNQFIETNFKNT